MTQYNDTDLLPYTEYHYEVEVENDHGKTKSSMVSLWTAQGIPSNDFTLQHSNTGSHSVTLTWNSPSKPNGIIQSYSLTSRTSFDTSPFVWYTGLEHNYTVNQLNSSTNYTFVVTVCTGGGCNDSNPTWIVTFESPPSGQNPPNISAPNSTCLNVSWMPPSMPNGD